MTWTTTPYATLADVHAMLDLTETSDDPFIQNLIDQAQSFIDRRIGYSFQQDGTVPSPATRIYSGNNAESLMIDDCIQFTQILEISTNTFLGANGVWVVGNTLTIDITADVYLGPANMSPGFILRRISGNPFYLGKQNYVVKGVFGQPAIPAEISRVCARIAAHWFKMRDTNYTDTISEQGFVRMRFEKELPKDVVEFIDSYRKRLFLTSWGS
jgi:hypothetical protein